MRHTTGSVFGVFKQPVHMYRGTVMAGIIQDEAVFNPKRGFAGGYRAGDHLARSAIRRRLPEPGRVGRGLHRATSTAIANMAGMWIVGEDMPQETNARDAPSRRERQVRPADPERATTTTIPTTSRCANYAYKRGAAVYEAVGATKTVAVPPYPSTHNLGTCRMSEKPCDGVCNKWGQTHDVPQSVHLGRQPVHHQRR